MKLDPARADLIRKPDGTQTLRLSDAGGLTQFGAHVETLPPGIASSLRHWHEAEDEFLFILDGVATVEDGTGAHQLLPMDAACWPHGAPNAHRVVNQGTAPVTYLIVGTRVAGDVCHYPFEGSRQVNGATHWQVLDADGSVLRQGALPAHLMNLAPRWGKPFDPANARPSIVRAGEALLDQATPAQVAALGDFSARLYSDTGGLSQFGAFVETLAPGARSSDRHWHEQEDEFLYMLSGEALLVEDAGSQPLIRGDCAAWPAGLANGHQVVNRSSSPCSYLVVGSRKPSDRVHYSEIDKLYTRENGEVRRTRRDGSPLESALP